MNAFISKIVALIMSILMFLFPSLFYRDVDVIDGLYETDGRSLTVCLDSNPSTGCSWVWKVTDGDGVIALEKSGYVPDKAPAGTAGSGGHDVYVFSTVSEGDVEITFTYGQHWSGGELFDEYVFDCTVGADGSITVNSVTPEA